MSNMSHGMMRGMKRWSLCAQVIIEKVNEALQTNGLSCLRASPGTQKPS